MRARASLLGALAIAGVLLANVAPEGARAQPFGRAFAPRLIQVDHERHEERHEDRGRGGQREQGGYRGQPYAPPPRGYAYPAPPTYPYPQRSAPPAYAPPTYPYPQRSAPPAYAPPPRPYNYTPAPPSRANAPLGQAMANIRRVMPGRILNAWTEAGPDGRPTYHVRWAAQGGKRVDFIVDAATGAIIGQSGY
jgi:hypothetical protein